MSATAGPSKKSKKESSKKVRAPSLVDSEASESSSVSDSSDIDAMDVDEVERVPARAPAKNKNSLRYEPPPGMEPLPVSVSFSDSPLEFDALANKPGVELWAIRVPADFKTSRLSGLNVKRTSDRVSGGLTAKNARYVLETAGEDDGAEMAGLALMVPSVKKGGSLFRAPVNISRRLILTPVEGDEDATPFVAPPKRKREQPAVLKFRSHVYGSTTAGPEQTVVAASEDDQAEPTTQSPQKSKKSKSEKDKKSDSPVKKKKKTKV